jgi:thymidylate synthase
MSNSHDQEYLRVLQYVLDNGIVKSDRTGTGTISSFGHQMRFDLSDGSIPLLTTKKMHTKSIIHELLWFISGSTNNNDLLKNDVTIWNEWADDVGQLGPVYGQMLRNYPAPKGYFPIPVKKVNDDTVQRNWKSSIPTTNQFTAPGKHTGKICTNKQGLQYEILNIDGFKQKASTYCVRFIESGWIKYGVRTALVLKGNFVDQSMPSLYGIGILGDYDTHNHSTIDQQLRKHWENMISRCYNPNDISYNLYGDGKVIVCNRWKVLSDFIIDVKKLNNWGKKLSTVDVMVLDKDYYGKNNIYHPSSCCWISHDDNRQYRHDAIQIEVQMIDTKLYFPSVNSACKFFGIKVNTIWMSNIRKKYPDVVNIKEYDNPNYVIRKLHSVDQLSWLINEIITDPTSRRMYVSYWNSSLLPIENVPKHNSPMGRQNLAPCHLAFQCYVANDKLDLQLYIRSNDLFLGNPFNIAQYAMLVHMLAQVCNLQPGELIVTIGDAHIYSNHVEQCKLQLSREPYHSPKLVLNKRITNIDHFTYDDFKIVDYTSHPAIKAPVAI